MKTYFSSLMNTRKKKVSMLAISISLIAIIAAGVVATLGNESAVVLPSEQTKDSPIETQPAEVASLVLGGIETSDGKKLTIDLGAGRDNNFAKMAWKKDEDIIFSVQCEQEQELEVGIMSVSTDEVYSGTVATGTGKVTITVPKDGDYRVYIKNHTDHAAHFILELNKKLEGPLA
ncbi:hypothetical protein ACFRAM_05350 [Paenibacillus sp. NPDC056722]|uniref:hypothetical protein n=1 Tax=Paenibacillus sp. NPDC056722 TaxID=3345924 RepID=UPI0036CF1ED6